MTHEATYSLEDDKLRLYPESRLPEDEYTMLKGAGYRWAPKQELFWAPWTPRRERILLEMCGTIADESMSVAERAAERAARFTSYADNAAQLRNISIEYCERDCVYFVTGLIDVGGQTIMVHGEVDEIGDDSEFVESNTEV